MIRVASREASIPVASSPLFFFFYYVFPFSSHNRQSIRNESLNAFHTISSKILFKEASCSKKKLKNSPYRSSNTLLNQ